MDSFVFFCSCLKDPSKIQHREEWNKERASHNRLTVKKILYFYSRRSYRKVLKPFSVILQNKTMELVRNRVLENRVNILTIEAMKFVTTSISWSQRFSLFSFCVLVSFFPYPIFVILSAQLIFVACSRHNFFLA